MFSLQASFSLLLLLLLALSACVCERARQIYTALHRRRSFSSSLFFFCEIGWKFAISWDLRTDKKGERVERSLATLTRSHSPTPGELLKLCPRERQDGPNWALPCSIETWFPPPHGNDNVECPLLCVLLLKRIGGTRRVCLSLCLAFFPSPSLPLLLFSSPLLTQKVTVSLAAPMMPLSRRHWEKEEFINFAAAAAAAAAAEAERLVVDF